MASRWAFLKSLAISLRYLSSFCHLSISSPEPLSSLNLLLNILMYMLEEVIRSGNLIQASIILAFFPVFFP